MNHGSLQAYVDHAGLPSAAGPASAPPASVPAAVPHPLGGQYVPLSEPAVPGRYVGDAGAGAPGSYTGAPAGEPGRYTDVDLA
ncbi:hypothetical protein [Agromyces bracchium]|uniref:Uncharacterized protein n=1 Tax=Agromyces bracchium TaxID=88376 RepID=A0A6I3M7R1_9MICO|nr:hypothetical protein [Agromyces bracchium]MTH68157.1 hypothetical protein [Agromyces bracchium]